ncbi:signal recognition particle-docking protein FtsY [Caldichromatium japonicum]|uniref:Signal recognition particle receptor FtsY n=1 Tax=Caldichromatium japonicum TaxID=2699430 RepID=A0A6G7VA11_9GAMM|nr:signal recognition particle-docking protein FtsY [Caldichromatium japonicum]QIK36899.1 signal recognition particle-docking protein FtsY [Caldichromatium japonicum]
MFGFGKKKIGPASNPDTTHSTELQTPASPVPSDLLQDTDALAGQPQPGAELSPEPAKRPWFGRLFRAPSPAHVPKAPETSAPDTPAVDGPRQPAESPQPVAERATAAEDETRPKRSVFARLRERLAKPRSKLGGGLKGLLGGRQRIDEDLLEEVETLLITADVGAATTARLITELRAQVKRKRLTEPDALMAALKESLAAILRAADGPVKQPSPGRPQVILMVGVNGAGKTTTIGKLAKRLQDEGNRVMLAAGDTFRAAAVEQLKTWGERNGVPVIAQQTGADSASVIFDALQAATARGMDVLIADTAGRLHTKDNLMEELAKVARVLKKIDPDAPHEVMLVIDATTGQNAIHQAEQFHRAVGLTGITLTKLDGTAKGGILFAIAERCKIPIRFIGVGEAIEDLRPFDPDAFVEALLD